ncbi:hypothetical protein GCM10009801_29520 [Streptomyces albiaxialis]|uniref:Uncharacterized protein n=1 Tax=Streptomyces albiaxialis TaxID=329523 RepID=A0ABP5HIC4_9ACTN
MIPHIAPATKSRTRAAMVTPGMLAFGGTMPGIGPIGPMPPMPFMGPPGYAGYAGGPCGPGAGWPCGAYGPCGAGPPCGGPAYGFGVWPEGGGG